MSKKPSAKVIKFPGNFAGQKMAEAAEKRPKKQLKKTVAKFKPGVK